MVSHDLVCLLPKVKLKCTPNSAAAFAYSQKLFTTMFSPLLVGPLEGSHLC